MTEESKGKLKSRAYGATAVAAITFLGTITTAIIEDRQKLEERVYLLEREVGELREKRQASDMMVLEFKHKLLLEVDKNKIIYEFMDSVPIAMWAKEIRDDGEFEMVMLNDKFEEFFGITKERYIGSTDAEIWPEYLAKMFKDGDMKVLKDKKYMCQVEVLILDKKKVPVNVCKFPFAIDRRKFLIGGIAFI